MVVRITYVFVFVCAMLLSASAAGQTTRPAGASSTPSPSSQSPAQAAAASSTAPAGWVRIMSQLTDALTGEAREGQAVADANDAAPTAAKPSIDSLVPDDVKIQSFGSSDFEPRTRLAQQTSGLTIVAVRAYAWPAETVASDLSTDVENCDVFPAALRKEFMPRDETDAKRANATAQQWIFNLLQPAPGQTVGVIVLWPTQPTIGVTSFGLTPAANVQQPAQQDVNQQPIFVLVKGTKAGDDDGGAFKIMHVIYGDVRRALN